MVIAYHLVWTTYGTWLPNDPRGSGSRTIASLLLAEFGELHYGRKKIQPSGRTVREFYRQAEMRLLFPVVRFNREQINFVGAAMADALKEFHYACYACAIMPDHVHLVIRKHKHFAEDMIDNLQEATRLRFSKNGDVSANHPVWTLGGWKRFLNSPAHVHNVIRYVENNPIEIGLPPQHWPFVIPYDNWPFHRKTASK